MQLMAGLVQPSSGEIWFDGRNVTGVPVQKRKVAMVFQQFINYPNLSVFGVPPPDLARADGAAPVGSDGAVARARGWRLSLGGASRPRGAAAGGGWLDLIRGPRRRAGGPSDHPPRRP